MPHSSIGTQAASTKFGWHGCVYGWKLHLVCAVGDVWIPLAALLSTASGADNTCVPTLLDELPLELRFLLGDQHYRDLELDEQCAHRCSIFITPKARHHGHIDSAAKLRRLFNQTRSVTIENFNEQFKDIGDGVQQVPTRGPLATGRCALAAIVQQLGPLYRHQHRLGLRVDLKASLRVA